MAEFVNARMEEKIPYLELLVLTELFAHEELKPILQQTTTREYAVQKGTRQLSDLVEYVSHQMKFLETITERREENNYFHKKELIEAKIKQEISGVLGASAPRFCHRLDYWALRIKFAKAMGWRASVRKLFEQATKLLGKKYPQLWIEASNYESNLGIQHIDAARKILQLGLRDNKECQALYLAGFKLEIDFVQFLSEHEEEREKILRRYINGDLILRELALAKVLYENAKRNCKLTEDLLHKFYSILEDLDTDVSKAFMKQIAKDASKAEKAAAKAAGPQDPLKILQIDLGNKLSNFSEHFNTVDDIRKALQSGKDIPDSGFWVKAISTVLCNHSVRTMKDMMSLCNIPTVKSIGAQLRLIVLQHYSLSSWSSGLEAARQWYSLVTSSCTSTMEIHLKMAEIELSAVNKDHEAIRKCFQKATLSHGKESIEPWIQFIDYEKRYFPHVNQHSLLHVRALTELNSSLAESFNKTLLVRQSSC